MVFTKATLLAAIGALTVSATPIPRGTGGLTADMLLQIDSTMATCAAANTQCATAAEAAPALNNAFAKWQITNPNQQAALVAYMYFESGHFVYNKNVSPGRPGQGTRMMAMPPFVAKYAAVAADPTELKAAQALTGDDQLNAILATVNKNNDLSFGAGAWFLSTQCDDGVKSGLSAGTMDGWHDFLTKCVGTSLDPARDTPYTAALKAYQGYTPGSSSPSGTPSGTPSTPTSAPSQAQPSKPAASQAQPTQPAYSAPAQPQPQPSKPAPSQAQPSKPAYSQAPPPSKPSASAAQPTEPSSQPSEPATPSQPAAYSQPAAPAAPSPTGTTSSSAPSTGNSGNTCSTNGAVVCNGENQFGLCNNGYVVWQNVAYGTTCSNGMISKRRTL